MNVKNMDFVLVLFLNVAIINFIEKGITYIKASDGVLS